MLLSLCGGVVGCVVIVMHHRGDVVVCGYCAVIVLCIIVLFVGQLVSKGASGDEQ
jgi:hypothetical protein